jgi:hypothetical protein
VFNFNKGISAAILRVENEPVKKIGMKGVLL